MIIFLFPFLFYKCSMLFDCISLLDEWKRFVHCCCRSFLDIQSQNIKKTKNKNWEQFYTMWSAQSPIHMIFIKLPHTYWIVACYSTLLCFNFFYVFSFHMAFTSFTWSTICCVFFSVEISSKKTISDCCLRNCRQIHLNNLIGRYRKTRSRGRKCRKKFKQLTKMNK